MNNVSTFGDTIYQFDFEYVLRLQDQLADIIENKKEYPDSAIRELETKVRLLKNRLLKTKKKRAL